MLKIIGFIFVISASSLLGFVSSNDYKVRIDDLLYIKNVIIMIRGEIKYQKAPLPEAFYHVGKRVKAPFDTFLLAISERLENKDGDTFSHIWKDEISKNLIGTRLLKKDLNLFMQIGEQLGYLDNEMQLASLDLYMEQLDVEIIASEKRKTEKCRIYQCVGIISGLFVSIILL